MVKSTINRTIKVEPISQPPEIPLYQDNCRPILENGADIGYIQPHSGSRRRVNIEKLYECTGLRIQRKQERQRRNKIDMLTYVNDSGYDTCRQILN